MGSFLSLDVLHAGVLDADLLAQELNLLLQPVGFGLTPEPRVHAVRGPASGHGQGGAGEGDDLDDRRTDATRPPSW